MSDALQPLDFSHAAAAALSDLPGVEVQDIGILELQIEASGRGVRVQLSNFYDTYQANPAALPAILDALREALGHLPPDPQQTDGSQLVDRLLPMLKPITLLHDVRERNLPMIAYRLFMEDVIITYVIDESGSVAFVNEQHLQTWGMTENTVHDHAMRNLRARPDPFKIMGSGARSLLVGASEDGYAATRLLLPERFAALQARLRGNIVIGIPNRDFLIAIGDDDPLIVRQVAAQVEADAQSKPYGITSQLFTLRDGTIQLYQE